MADGAAVLLTMVANSAGVPQIALLGVKSDQIELVSKLTMPEANNVVVLAEPSSGWSSGKALLYGGIAVAAVAGIGLVYYLSTRKN